MLLSTSGIARLAVAALLLPFASARYPHRKRDFRVLSDSQVEGIATLDPPEWDAVVSGHLEHLLIPRVSGTENNTRVQEYISSVFSKLGWHEEKYMKRMPTPMGELPFTNLVYTFDPDAPRKVVLSAHFDSKWFEEGGFIGATDSAAPCATMIDVAEALTPLLKARGERLKAGKPLKTAEVDEEEAGEVTLQLIFFDGEEAFHTWSATDSVYGSRHLAETWQHTLLPENHPFQKRRLAPMPNVLDTMDVLVLLDLLGARGPRMRSFYPETRYLFDQLADADKRLREAGLVDTKDPKWFTDFPGAPNMVDDDHRPFLHRGVPILHLISLPFPGVWHNMKDNADALDLPSLRRWNRIMRVWTAGYLGLSADDAHPSGDKTTDKVTDRQATEGIDIANDIDDGARLNAIRDVDRSELVRIA